MAVSHQLVKQVAAHGSLGAHTVFQFRHTDRHHLVHIFGHLPHRHGAAKHHVDGVDIIAQVELRPAHRVRCAADPDCGQPARNAGFLQIGAGQIGQWAKQQHKQRAGILFHRFTDDQLRAFAGHRGSGIRQSVGRTVQHRNRQLHQGRQVFQPLPAFLHSVGVAGAKVGGHHADIIKLGAQQCLHNSKRIVRFVAKVGIGNYTHHFFFRHGEVVVGTGHAFLLFYVPGAAACSGGSSPFFIKGNTA